MTTFHLRMHTQISTCSWSYPRSEPMKGYLCQVWPKVNTRDLVYDKGLITSTWLITHHPHVCLIITTVAMTIVRSVAFPFIHTRTPRLHRIITLKKNTQESWEIAETMVICNDLLNWDVSLLVIRMLNERKIPSDSPPTMIGQLELIMLSMYIT